MHGLINKMMRVHHSPAVALYPMLLKNKGLIATWKTVVILTLIGYCIVQAMLRRFDRIAANNGWSVTRLHLVKRASPMALVNTLYAVGLRIASKMPSSSRELRDIYAETVWVDDYCGDASSSIVVKLKPQLSFTIWNIAKSVMFPLPWHLDVAVTSFNTIFMRGLVCYVHTGRMKSAAYIAAFVMCNAAGLCLFYILRRWMFPTYSSPGGAQHAKAKRA